MSEVKTLETVQAIGNFAGVSGLVPGVNKFIPGGYTLDVAGNLVASAVDPALREARAKEGLGHDLNRLHVGYSDVQDDRVIAEAKEGWFKRALRGFGKAGAMLAVSAIAMAVGGSIGAVGFIPGAVMGAIAGLALSIPANIAVSWLYEKIVPKTCCQDAPSILAKMKETRKAGQEVSPEMVLAAMVSSIPLKRDTFNLRKDFEQRLYAVSGERQIMDALEANPQAITKMMQEPEFNRRMNDGMADHYGAPPVPDFINRTTRLFNNNQIGARALMYAEAPDVSNAMMADLQAQSGYRGHDQLVRQELPPHGQQHGFNPSR